MAAIPPHLRTAQSSESVATVKSNANGNRDSNMVRASILNTALELGVGRNKTVTNWMFNGIDEEDEEEESTMSPALTSASTATSDEGVFTPQNGRGGFVYPRLDAYKPDAPSTIKPPGRTIAFDLTRPPPTPDNPSSAQALPPVPQSNSGFLRYRLGKSKSKREDGYETDGAATDSGSKGKIKKKKSKKEVKGGGEGYETDGAGTDSGKKKSKKKKDKEDGEESDGGYLSDFTRSRKKKKEKKAKEAAAAQAEDTDASGYLSEASAKRKKSFFSRNAGKSGSNSNSRGSPSSETPPPVPALPDFPPNLPIAGRFQRPSESNSRSDTPLSRETPDSGAHLKKVPSHSSGSSTRESNSRENASFGHSGSFDRSSERGTGSHESQRDALSSPSKAESNKSRFNFGRSPSNFSGAETTLPTISLPNSRAISPMPSGGVSPGDTGSRRPTPLNLSTPSGSAAASHSPSLSLNSEYIFVTPGATPNKSNPNANLLPVSPAPTDYSLVPSVPGNEYTNPSPQPSPAGLERPNALAHYDLPPPSPPPSGPLPDVPQHQNGPSVPKIEIKVPKAGPPSSFLDFEAQSPSTSRSTSPMYSGAQRGRTSPFPVQPLLPPEESAELIQRTKSPTVRSSSALGYYQNRPSERLRRGHNLSEDGLRYLDERPGPLVRSPSTMARTRPDVSRAPDVMAGVSINVEQASEADDAEWDDRAELDEVISRFQDSARQERAQQMEPSIPAGRIGSALSPRLRSPNSHGNSSPQPRIIVGRDPGYGYEPEDEEEYGEIEDEDVEDDDDKSYYPEDDKTAGRSTMYMMENGEDLRYSMYTDGDRTSRGSFLNEDKSWDARQRFLQRVEALYEDTGREKPKPPPVPKLDPALRAKFQN
ncbi:hypothetical protein GLOTRDRAFT_122393 [Gloeophyllum trabeum ATCC 11539]|uniref:Uncharacterized protein n=1 Tax=Gloeophyllum trabeum (strain ATCC 11539 / FP-39264 / Madison 617) TaxID=670483 RepID=S7RFX9_GLOTA|nr:uncharacterized protein GLOTRDRAFT_122393 [Gloeophyllum trabeum ATCC 11539]EPQ53110.1 hypothetical protein GLOTRDRAFT_122393 [Gloeophyllum trabeum ATCC 11539]